MTHESSFEQRAKQLFKSRFLRQAESPDAEAQIDEQLTGKISKLDAKRGRNMANLRRLVEQASQLWQERSHLNRKDLVYLAAALLYFISPIDAVPDLIPGIGYLDDIVILTWIVSTILRGVSTLAIKGKDHVDSWIDARTDVVFEKLDEAASHGVQNAVTTVAVGLWGTTTAAAISLAVATILGSYPSEWIAYVVVSAALILTWNITVLLFYLQEYRKLDGKWRQRIRTLIASKIAIRHVVAVGLPICVLVGLGVFRALVL